MSIVPSTGIVRKHYKEALENVGYKSSAFWQVWLQRAFPENEIYSVTGESSPDGSLRRVDMVVKRYDATHDTIFALLWIECKRPSGNVGSVERQALDAALRCISTDNLLWIYAMTTVGLSFRTWFVEKGGNTLVPLHGTAVEADRTQYIDADSEGGWVLDKTVHLVKSQVPLREAPILPSQPLHSMPVAESAQGGSDTFVTQYGDQAESSSAMVPEYTESQSNSLYVEVSVKRTPHLTRRDEYVFSDSKGHQKSTDREDWERIIYQGQEVWAFYGKKTTYFSRKRIA